MDDLFKLEEKNKLLLKEIQCQKAKLNTKEEEIESSKRELKWLTEYHKKLLKRVAEFLLRYDFDDEDYQSLIEDYLQIYDVTREEFKKKFRPKDVEALKNHSNFLWTRIHDLIATEKLKKLEIDDVKL